MLALCSEVVKNQENQENQENQNHKAAERGTLREGKQPGQNKEGAPGLQRAGTLEIDRRYQRTEAL